MAWFVFLAVGASAGINSEITKDMSVDVIGLHMLLNDTTFATEFVPMVSQA